MGRVSIIKRQRKLFVLVFSACLLVQILFDPLSVLLNIVRVNLTRYELRVSQELWRSRGINSYTIEVRGFAPLICIYQYRLNIKNGELVSAVPYELGDNNFFDAVDLSKQNMGVCEIGSLTIPNMFARVSDNLNAIDILETEVKVEFDPVFGFVTSYENHTGYRQGFLAPRVSDGYISY